MKQYIIALTAKLQYPLLILTYYWCKFFLKSSTKISWVIGVDEIAKFIYLLKNIFENSYAVSFSKNKFYTFQYDFTINIKNKYVAYAYKLFIGPILLGYLMNKSDKFLYIWSTGFLIDRKYEFEFLKKKKKKIVCIFLGDDIRSPKLLQNFYTKNKLDGFVEYVSQQIPSFRTNDYESEKKYIAKIADDYADLIFSCPIDQISYLKSKQLFISYMYDKNMFYQNQDKFIFRKKIKILHAPSSPLVKGTPLVRATIKKLQMEGYDFEYVELQNIPNEIVLEHLKTSHIVLNQFYAFVPGVFGIESMANHCAVLMSADPSIETGLPQDSKDAWMITKYWEVYDNLKYLLDNPEKIEYYANNGYEFTYKHYSYEAASDYMNNALKENGII
jgi:hypothetical protein